MAAAAATRRGVILFIISVLLICVVYGCKGWCSYVGVRRLIMVHECDVNRILQ